MKIFFTKCSQKKKHFFSPDMQEAVGHGVGHKDAAGVLPSMGAPLWFIKGCGPLHTLFGREEEKQRKEPGGQEEVRLFFFCVKNHE
jgi:hypothetical protein